MAANSFVFALGLAQKAGKVVSGDFSVRSVLKSGKGKLLLLAQDASPNSKKDMHFLADNARVPVIETLSRDEMGHAIGKAKRVAVVITDDNFADMLMKQ